MQREQRGGGEEEEDEELVPPPGIGHRVLPPGLPEHRRVRGVDHGAERAEPSAEEAAQRDREERDDQRGPDQPDERPPRKGGGPRHQGIEPEKQVDRVRKDVVVLVLRVQEEEDEEKEHDPLRGAPKRPRRLHPGTSGVVTFLSAMFLLYQQCRRGAHILPVELTGGLVAFDLPHAILIHSWYESRDGRNASAHTGGHPGVPGGAVDRGPGPLAPGATTPTTCSS